MSFIRVKGLAERIEEAERIDERLTRRFLRRLHMPQAKRQRLIERYHLWIAHHLPGPSSRESYEYHRERSIRQRQEREQRAREKGE